MTHRALISVADKTNVVELARGLAAIGLELVSSSGTAQFLRDAGLNVTDVADVTAFPAILGGRVKTLHPAVFGGILARQERPDDMKELETHQIAPVDVVVCNLYPFEKAARSEATLDELIEEIDIGGVTLLRAAAKNYRHVTVLCDSSDYQSFLDELEAEGTVSCETRRRLALKAFAMTSRYDATILHGLCDATGDKVPVDAPLALREIQPLRYGENPHQQASLLMPTLSYWPLEVQGGKELSYNNILDIDAAMRATSLLSDAPSAAVIKHTTPCGVATGETLFEAWEGALACDPLSAFGGIVALTRGVDVPMAEAIAQKFIEVLLCPEICEDAVALLAQKRPALRVVTWRGGRIFDQQMVSTWCGLLTQTDALPPLPLQDKGQWIGTPRPDLWNDLILAWKTAALSKSNAVAIVKDRKTVGIGMGFCSRIFAVDFALNQAGEKARDAVMASDAFFPFADSIEKIAEAGIAAVIQPGGSVKDQEVFARATQLGVSLFITGKRTFRH